MQQEPERAAGRDRSEHARRVAVPRSNAIIAKVAAMIAQTPSRQPIHAIGEVDDVHHRRPARSRSASVRRCGKLSAPKSGTVRCSTSDAGLFGDNRRGDLARELERRMDVEAIVDRADDRDHSTSEQHAVPVHRDGHAAAATASLPVTTAIRQPARQRRSPARQGAVWAARTARARADDRPCRCGARGESSTGSRSAATAVASAKA